MTLISWCPFLIPSDRNVSMTMIPIVGGNKIKITQSNQPITVYGSSRKTMPSPVIVKTEKQILARQRITTAIALIFF